MSLTVVTANIGRRVGHAEAEQNIRRVRRAFHTRPLVFFQEIDEYDGPDEHAIVQKHFAQGYDFANLATMVPTAVPKPWVVERTELTIASKGKPKVSPHRIVNEALIRNKDRPALPAIAMLGGHFAYNDDELWGEAFDTWTERVHFYVNRGHTVVGGLDSNKHGRMEKFHPHQRWINTNGTIDRLFYIEGSVQVDVQATGTIDLTVDGHNAHWTRLGFSR